MKAEKILNPAFPIYKEAEDGFMYRGINGLVVIQSVAVEDDGNPWLHTSFSRKSRMPSYDDMAMIRRIFIPQNKKAVMIFPDKDHHVNIHPFCLHFFTPMYHEPLPEFSKDGNL